MHLLVNVLEQTDKLPAILEGFARIGVKGTTILHSTGMGRVLMQSGANVPATDEARKSLVDDASLNKTTLTYIKERSLVDQAIEVIKTHCGDLNQPGKGVVFVLPVEFVDGVN